MDFVEIKETETCAFLCELGMPKGGYCFSFNINIKHKKREINLLFRRMDVIGFVLSCSILAKKNFKLEMVMTFTILVKKCIINRLREKW